MGVQNRQAPFDVVVGRTAELARVAAVVAQRRGLVAGAGDLGGEGVEEGQLVGAEGDV